MMSTATANYLGPATVSQVVADRIRIDLPHGEAWARLALSTPYHPEPGDVVLAIGEEEIYIIGVLLGRGKTTFVAPGDLELRARGTIALVGDKGVQIRGPEVSVRADRFEMVARSAVEKLIESYRWVKDVIQTRAGRTRTIVDGASTLHAERIVETADKDVTLDGQKIRLG
jgi:hypothetical protein